MTATASHPAGLTHDDTVPFASDLAAAVAGNLSRLRRNSGTDVEQLAADSGLSIEHVLALEDGRTIPSLRTLWALAKAFDVPFGILISGAPCTTASFHVLRAAGSRIVDSGDGFRTRPLSAAGDPREPEVYEVTLAPAWREDAAAHAEHERAVPTDERGKGGLVPALDEQRDQLRVGAVGEFTSLQRAVQVLQ